MGADGRKQGELRRQHLATRDTNRSQTSPETKHTHTHTRHHQQRDSPRTHLAVEGRGAERAARVGGLQLRRRVLVRRRGLLAATHRLDRAEVDEVGVAVGVAGLQARVDHELRRLQVAVALAVVGEQLQHLEADLGDLGSKQQVALEGRAGAGGREAVVHARAGVGEDEVGAVRQHDDVAQRRHERVAQPAMRVNLHGDLGEKGGGEGGGEGETLVGWRAAKQL